MNKLITHVITLALGLLCISVHAKDIELQKTQHKLHEVNAQITNLQKTLHTAHNQQGVLNKELAVTETQIGQGVRKLRTLQKNMTEKTAKITGLQHQIHDLNQQLTTQQSLLAGHVRARYKMGEYQPLKWLLNQDNPYKISRILTYYQYIVTSRQQLIEQINKTREHLQHSKTVLASELKATEELNGTLTKQQEQLEQNKTYHTRLINTLSNDIQNKQTSLHEAQKNKDNLARLLKVLSVQSVTHASMPFKQMRKKLPAPIQAQRRSLRKMNQGVTFFADEGTPVSAVYPGKVVFSDWLKGYGLLLIIDHGQGFMSLYAHNESLFKRKGQNVQQNEQIASVGHSGGIKQNGLYFEIRLKGKAISPLDWLSQG